MGKQKIQKATDWLLDQESYPNNLLVAAKGRSDCALPAALIRDVLDGIHYALSSLPEMEQTDTERSQRGASAAASTGSGSSKLCKELSS